MKITVLQERLLWGLMDTQIPAIALSPQILQPLCRAGLVGIQPYDQRARITDAGKAALARHTAGKPIIAEHKDPAP